MLLTDCVVLIFVSGVTTPPSSLAECNCLIRAVVLARSPVGPTHRAIPVTITGKCSRRARALHAIDAIFRDTTDWLDRESVG